MIFLTLTVGIPNGEADGIRAINLQEFQMQKPEFRSEKRQAGFTY
jgi:hypothetical protein